jgi:hypothetical protein
MQRIWPLVVYPFVQPKELGSLKLLFETLAELKSDTRFCKPVTIVNNQTYYRNNQPWTESTSLPIAHAKAIAEIVEPVSTVTHTWATDTCAMWLRGLGDAFSQSASGRSHHDVFWLIPGDFNYLTEQGRTALKKLTEIPFRVYDGSDCEICLGEIQVPVNSAKQLIDTYGTYGLLYNWFPAEAQGIRKITDKPRTEFFALNYPTLGQALIRSRWYGYEQTLMILLQNMNGDTPGRPIKRVNLGMITDEEDLRATLAGAMQQVERTERALKQFWREREISRGKQNWQDQFRVLDAQSESVRTAAMVILRRVLA